MNKQQFIKWLENNDACEESIEWLRGQKTLKQAWENCTNAIWMLWLLDRLPVSDNTLRLLACDFVRYTPLNDGRTIWDLLTDERSRNAVIVAERYALGEASQADLIAAWDAAWDAATAWDAARVAAWVAAWATARDAAWDVARDAARDAARVAAWDAARATARDAAWDAAWAVARDAARDAAWDAARDAQCDIIRKRISWKVLKSLLGGVA